jgi:hypothetical protein
VTAADGSVLTRSSAWPDLFEDLAVTARRALVPTATSQALLPLGQRARQAVSSRHAVRHDGGVANDGGTDWAGYYAWSAGREPRPLLLAACEELGAGQRRLAIDLVCGEGTDTLELLAHGWSVLAVNAASAGLAVLRARIPPAAAGAVRVLCASFTTVRDVILKEDAERLRA